VHHFALFLITYCSGNELIIAYRTVIYYYWMYNNVNKKTGAQYADNDIGHQQKSRAKVDDKVLNTKDVDYKKKNKPNKLILA
jgi:hypothetical protein